MKKGFLVVLMLSVAFLLSLSGLQAAESEHALLKLRKDVDAEELGGYRQLQ